MYKQLGKKIGKLVESKQVQYGDSTGKSGAILSVIYPNGIMPHQFPTALLVVRILDKICRLAQQTANGKDLGGESPFRDIAGYALLGLVAEGDKNVT